MRKFHSLFQGMHGNKLMRIVWLIATGSFFAGLFWVMTSFIYLSNTSHKIEMKLQDINRLLAIKEEVDRVLAARNYFEKMTVKQPSSFTELLESNKSLAVADRVNETSRTLGNGWSYVSRELNFNSVELAKVIELADKIELAGEASNNIVRPQWRLAEYVIKALPDQSGYVSVKQVFTSIRMQ